VIHFVNSYQVALVVFQILNMLIRGTEDEGELLFNKTYATLFKNGREQGVCLQNYFNRTSIAFAEYRSSDDIVVYKFESNINDLPAEGEWDNRRMFNYNEHYKAAEYIHELLQEARDSA